LHETINITIDKCYLSDIFAETLNLSINLNFTNEFLDNYTYHTDNWHNAMTLGTMALGIMTIVKMTFGTMIFDIMMLGINTWHNVTMAS